MNHVQSNVISWTTKNCIENCRRFKEKNGMKTTVEIGQLESYLGP